MFILLKCWKILQKGEFENLFPHFKSFTIQTVFVYNGFVYNGVSFPPTIRYRQGLPVFCYLALLFSQNWRKNGQCFQTKITLFRLKKKSGTIHHQPLHIRERYSQNQKLVTGVKVSFKSSSGHCEKEIIIFSFKLCPCKKTCNNLLSN